MLPDLVLKMMKVQKCNNRCGICFRYYSFLLCCSSGWNSRNTGIHTSAGRKL